MPLIINDEVVPEQRLTNELLRLSSGLEMDAPQAASLDHAALRSLALRNVVDRTLLLQTARSRGLQVTAAEAQAERARRWQGVETSFCATGVQEAIAEDLLIERISSDLTRHVPRPGRTDAEDFYRRNRILYFLPEARHVAHIIRNAASPAEEPAARQILERAATELAHGRPFAKVADQYSDCRGAGGSLGWISPGEMVPEFEAVVFALPLRTHSSIFRTVFGLHIATVLKHRAAGHRAFEEVRSEIASRIFRQRRQAALTHALVAIERSSNIHFTEEPAHA